MLRASSQCDKGNGSCQSLDFHLPHRVWAEDLCFESAKDVARSPGNWNGGEDFHKRSESLKWDFKVINHRYSSAIMTAMSFNIIVCVIAEDNLRPGNHENVPRISSESSQDMEKLWLRFVENV